MTDILQKLVEAILGNGSGQGVTPILLIIVGYLGWKNYNDTNAHREELDKLRVSNDALQTKINDQRGEERDTLLEIIEKYHQSQTSVREAISEVKTVLQTMNSMNRGSGSMG